jgi:gliding motility-associated protein GldC
MEKHPKEVTTKEIRIEVGMDENGMPIDIRWQADDSNADAMSSKALIMTLFDRKTKETMKIDLWTKDFMIMEMDRLMYNSLRGLSDAYYRGSSNKQLADQMQQFAQFFGEETEIIPRS